MHGMVLHAPQAIEQEPLTPDECPVPLPGPNEVRLRVHVCEGGALPVTRRCATIALCRARRAQPSSNLRRRRAGE